MAHTGAWGTPDFGITERVSDLFGRNRTSQGGSNIFGGAQASQGSAPSPVQSQAPIPTSQGQVLGASTVNTGANTASAGGSAKTAAKTGGGAPVPSPSPQPNTPPMPSGPDQGSLDSAYNPLLDYLSQAESQLRGDYPTYQNEANRAAANSTQELTNSYNSATQQLGNQQQQAGQQREDVITAARRLFQELQMGNSQRFGGASSAGQAASELQGRELQRNTSTAQKQYSDLAQQLGQKKIEIDSNYQLNKQKIEDQRQSTINQINRDFQDKLLSISQRRGEVESAKASARLNALQEYRDKVYQVQLQNYQYQQQLEAMKSQQDQTLRSTEQSLLSSVSGGQGMLNNYVAGTSTDPTTNLSVNAQNTPGQPVPAYTGQIDDKKRYLDPAFMYRPA